MKMRASWAYLHCFHICVRLFVFVNCELIYDSNGVQVLSESKQFSLLRKQASIAQVAISTKMATSTFLRRGMQPQNAFTAAKIRFVPHFRELRLSWTHNSLMSEGVEQFVLEFMPIIRENNPHINFKLLRTHTECDPFVVGEYAWQRSRAKRCSWKTKHQVLSMVEEMAIGGDYRPGKKRGVNRRLPRGQELWDTETIGHDVFKVYSRWKGDGDGDGEGDGSVTHPHFVHRKY